MPKKFSDIDKREWLKLYEDGKTEIRIAREHARCDVRTVRRGIEEARRKQDAKIARAELLREALRKHQDSLLKELDATLSTFNLPTEDFVVIPWNRGVDFILTEFEALTKEGQTGNASVLAIASRSQGGAMRRLLKEHLKNDRLWKVLAQCEKVYKAHLIARIVFQGKVLAVLQEKTGLKLVDRYDAPQPCIYSPTTGDLFFKAALQQASGAQEGIDLENDIAANTATGEVWCHSVILAKAPGNEETVKVNLVDAFRHLKESSEAVSVVDSYEALKEATLRIRQVVEQIKLLGLIPGQCEICRRLGM